MTRASTTARYVRPVQGRGAGLTGGLTVPRRSSLASWCSARCSASACAGWRAPACCSATAPTSSRTSQCASGGGSGGSATRRSASACRRRPRRSSPSAHRAARAVHAARITPVFSVSPTLQVSWHRIAPRGHRCRHFSLAPGAAVAVRGALLLPAVGSFICFAVHTPCERSAAAEGVVARCERLTGHNPVGFSLSRLRCARRRPSQRWHAPRPSSSRACRRSPAASATSACSPTSTMVRRCTHFACETLCGC